MALSARERFDPQSCDSPWFGPLHDVYLRFKRGELKALARLDEAAICARYAAIY